MNKVNGDNLRKDHIEKGMVYLHPSLLLEEIHQKDEHP